MTEGHYDKPLPLLDGFAKDFYGFCKQRELRFQRCRDCRAWRHVPREMCPQCGSWNWDWEKSSGRGKIFTWTVVARPMHPAFKDDCPYAAVVVEMEEGVRLLSQVTDCPPDRLTVDAAVQVVFEDVNPEIALPRFELASKP